MGVLIASSYLAPRFPTWTLAALAAVAATAIFVRWPQFGLVALVVVSLFLPFAVATGTQTQVNATILLLALLAGLWLLRKAHRSVWRLALSRPIVALLAFLLVAILAFVAGIRPWTPFAQTAPFPTQLGGLAIFLLSGCGFLLVADQVDDLAGLKALVWCFIVCASVYLLASLSPQIAFRELILLPGAGGSLLWVWLTAMAATQGVFNRHLHFTGRLALLGLALLTFALGWFLGRHWVSGWLPPLVVLIMILWLRSWRLGLLVTAIGSAYILWSDPGLVESLFLLKDYSILTRNVARDLLLTQILPLNPILGLGPGNYYWYTPLFPILGFYVQFNSHNNYVDILLQTGLLGLACFAWFVFEVGRLGWGLRCRVPAGFEQAYVYGALAGLGGTLVAAWLGDWFLPFVYNIGFVGFRSSMLGWLFLGGLVALDRLQTDESTA